MTLLTGYLQVRVTPMRTEVIIRATRTQNVLGEWSAPSSDCWPGSALQGTQRRNGMADVYKQPALQTSDTYESYFGSKWLHKVGASNRRVTPQCHGLKSWVVSPRCVP